MSDYLASFGIPDWLPQQVQRRMHAEAVSEARTARRAERERESRHERAEELARAAYREAAEARGEYVSALALASGEVAGRTVAEVLAGALAAAGHEDARSAAREARAAQGEVPVVFGEPVIGRSGWPASEYECARQLERASDLHRDLVVYRARRNYPAAEEAARAKSAYAQRGSVQALGSVTGDITRVVTPDGAGQMGNWLGEPV
jgi:hypothetical protein